MPTNRKDVTRLLSELTEKLINPKNDTRVYSAKEVTFDYSTIHPTRVDYMMFKPINNTAGGIEKGDFYCYEIKSSVDDFISKCGHNFIGDLNYCVVPENVYRELGKEINLKSGGYAGVYILPEGASELRLAKKAKRKDRNRPASEMLLMMFRSANREIIKWRNDNVQDKDRLG